MNLTLDDEAGIPINNFTGTPQLSISPRGWFSKHRRWGLPTVLVRRRERRRDLDPRPARQPGQRQRRDPDVLEHNHLRTVTLYNLPVWDNDDFQHGL